MRDTSEGKDLGVFVPGRAGVSPGHTMLQDYVALDQEEHPVVLGIWGSMLRAVRHRSKSHGKACLPRRIPILP